MQTKAALRRNLVLRLAPTGVAAHTIDGQTLHKLLKLPIGGGRHFQELATATLQSVQAELHSVQYLIIDEKSMISLPQLKMIELRLSQICGSLLPFGGMNIVLLGDFFQLPPVAGLLLFSVDLENAFDIGGRNDYYSFNSTIELTRLMR